MTRWLRPSAVFSCLCGVSGWLGAQDPFPEGREGRYYYCPRIDLLPAEQGGPQEVELDGELDEEVWSRADWQGWVNEASAVPRGGGGLTPDEDLDFEWAAVTDGTWIYVAWRIVDDVKQNSEQTQCNVWNDDSVELYIDAENDGPDCTASGDHCYGVDDAQFTVGLENEINAENPEALIFGGVAGGPACDFAGAHPQLCQGVARSVLDDDEVYAGWQAEIAIALETIGNNDDGTPSWLIEPDHGTIIGWNLHGQDDDNGGDRDHKLIWSQREVTESAWRNPAAFGKLVFVDLSEELPEFTGPVEDLTCTRNPDGTVSLRWSNPPDANTARPIRILVDGQQVAEVAGTSESAELPLAAVPRDDQDHEINVLNSGNSPALCLIIQAPFDDCGGIRRWNVLGAFNCGGASPGPDAIRRDYLTDGDTSELDFLWYPGATIATDFGGAAASTGAQGGPSGRNPGGIPTVFDYTGASSRVFFQSAAAFGGNIDNVMAYAQVYVIAEEDTEVFFGITSDDSVQVLLNEQEVWINSVPRGGRSVCQPQDVTTAPALLEAGYNSLIVKVFDGCCDWDFALRFQDAAGQPITAGLSLSLYPEGACPTPPLVAARSFDADETILIQCQERPKWTAGATYAVELALSSVRAAGAGPDCPAAPTAVTIVERVPAGWTPRMPSDGGRVEGETITWELSGAGITARVLRYEVVAGEEVGDVRFAGTIREAGSLLTFGVGGEGLLFNPRDFSEAGFVRTMLLLGPYARTTGFLAPGPNPGEDNIRLDYLTDGQDIEEQNVEPRAGDQVRTAYGPAGPAASIGLAPPASPNGINPDGIPTWKEWRDLDDTIDFDDYYGGDVNTVMMYAVFYVVAEENMTVDLGIGSDDSIQVLIDGTEVWINNIPRGFGAANTVQDTVIGVDLSRGHHIVMVKVFEGIGDHGFRLRFQDGFGDPLTEEDGLSICLSPEPEECGEVGPPPPGFTRGDADSNRAIELTDGVFVFNWLFLGGPEPRCMAAADASKQGGINLTSGVYILNFLFLGGPPPPPPFPGCGPSSDPLDLATGCLQSQCP